MTGDGTGHARWPLSTAWRSLAIKLKSLSPNQSYKLPVCSQCRGDDESQDRSTTETDDYVLIPSTRQRSRSLHRLESLTEYTSTSLTIKKHQVYYGSSKSVLPGKDVIRFNNVLEMYELNGSAGGPVSPAPSRVVNTNVTLRCIYRSSSVRRGWISGGKGC